MERVVVWKVGGRLFEDEASALAYEQALATARARSYRIDEPARVGQLCRVDGYAAIVVDVDRDGRLTELGARLASWARGDGDPVSDEVATVRFASGREERVSVSALRPPVDYEIEGWASKGCRVW